MKSKDVIETMKADGLRVYMRKPSDTYCFITDGQGIAYAQWGNSSTVGVSTVHVPNTTTGTGFALGEEIIPANVRKAMKMVAPSWALQRELASVHKYKNWEEFHGKDSWHAQLVEV